MHVNKCKNTVNECKYRLYTILHKTVSELCVHSVYKGDSHVRAKEMLCKCCANLGIKKVKALKISTLTFAFVGATGLEPATAWSQTRNATNCATPRFCGCKGTHFLRPLQIFPQLFIKILAIYLIIPCSTKIFFRATTERSTCSLV